MDMAVVRLTLARSQHHSPVGQEHGRTIPLTDLRPGEPKGAMRGEGQCTASNSVIDIDVMGHIQSQDGLRIRDHRSGAFAASRARLDETPICRTLKGRFSSCPPGRLQACSSQTRIKMALFVVAGSS
jgi:hypothetical protein